MAPKKGAQRKKGAKKRSGTATTPGFFKDAFPELYTDNAVPEDIESFGSEGSEVDAAAGLAASAQASVPKAAAPKASVTKASAKVSAPEASGWEPEAGNGDSDSDGPPGLVSGSSSDAESPQLASAQARASVPTPAAAAAPTFLVCKICKSKSTKARWFVMKLIGAAGNEVAFGSFCWECGMTWESYAKLTEEELITKFHSDAAFRLGFQ